MPTEDRRRAQAACIPAQPQGTGGLGDPGVLQVLPRTHLSADSPLRGIYSAEFQDPPVWVWCSACTSMQQSPWTQRPAFSATQAYKPEQTRRCLACIAAGHKSKGRAAPAASPTAAIVAGGAREVAPTAAEAAQVNPENFPVWLWCSACTSRMPSSRRGPSGQHPFSAGQVSKPDKTRRC